MICQKWIDEVGYLSSLGNVLLEREKIPWKYTVTFMVADIG